MNEETGRLIWQARIGLHDITCSKCRRRHPAIWTCAIAAAMAEAHRERERAQQAPEPIRPPDAADPFADVRDKRLSELSDEQKDRAAELWLRMNYGWEDRHLHGVLESVFRVINRLREPAPTGEVDAARLATIRKCRDMFVRGSVSWRLLDGVLLAEDDVDLEHRASPSS